MIPDRPRTAAQGVRTPAPARCACCGSLRRRVWRIGSAPSGARGVRREPPPAPFDRSSSNVASIQAQTALHPAGQGLSADRSVKQSARLVAPPASHLRVFGLWRSASRCPASSCSVLSSTAFCSCSRLEGSSTVLAKCRGRIRRRCGRRRTNAIRAILNILARVQSEADSHSLFDVSLR